MTFIGTKKIYPLFNIFFVKPNDMYLFGNLYVFKVHFLVQLDHILKLYQIISILITIPLLTGFSSICVCDQKCTKSVHS